MIKLTTANLKKKTERATKTKARMIGWSRKIRVEIL